jgi:Ca-activated chloride channel family protein
VAAHRLYERLRSPLLTDVSIDWGGLPVKEIYPSHLPDLFSGKPLVVSGRYTAATSGTIRIRGKHAGENFVREIPVNLSAKTSAKGIQATFWARRKIDDLMSQDWAGLQSGSIKPGLQQEITQLGLDYRLMTQFTSFVAVEERTITKDGQPVRVEVPVEMPEGVSYEGVFGNERDKLAYAPNYGLTMYSQLSVVSKGARVSRGVVAHKMAAPASGVGSGAGVGSGSAGGVGGGVLSSPSTIPNAPSPPPSAAAQTVNVDAMQPAEENAKPTGERAILESKLSPVLLAAFDCWKKSAADCKQVKDGVIELQLFLTADTEEVRDQLKALGFSLSQEPTTKKMLAGRLPIDRLPALAKLDAVRFIAPLRR